MALAVNVYKTVTQVIPTSAVGIYTAPVGYSSVVLLAQISNVGSSTQTVTVSLERSVAGSAVTTEIVKNFPVPVSDSASILDGKLVMESNDIIKVSASNGSDLKFIGSVLETLN